MLSASKMAAVYFLVSELQNIPVDVGSIRAYYIRAENRGSARVCFFIVAPAPEPLTPPSPPFHPHYPHLRRGEQESGYGLLLVDQLCRPSHTKPKTTR